MTDMASHFDPVGVVIDWLDAARAGLLPDLLALYDEQAILECRCDSPQTLTGPAAIAAYWRVRLSKRVPNAFDLEDVALDAAGVRLDYRNAFGNEACTYFSFSNVGKILHTACAPLRRFPGLQERAA